MLSRVEVRTRRGTQINFPILDVMSGYILTAVEGLDPVKANIVSSSFANKDGAQFQSVRREARNLKLKFDLEPDYVDTTVESLRNRLYSFLMPKKEVDLHFVREDGLEVDITGIVESHDDPVFVKDPAVDVSLMCLQPDFIDPNLVSLDGMSTELATETDIVYTGNIETGFVVTVTLDRAESAITFYLRTPDNRLHQIDFAAPLLSGDILRISTVIGEKGAWLTRAGVESSILYGIPPDNEWPQLDEGTNKLRVYATGTALPYTFEYITRYGGL